MWTWTRIGFYNTHKVQVSKQELFKANCFKTSLCTEKPGYLLLSCVDPEVQNLQLLRLTRLLKTHAPTLNVKGLQELLR